MRKSWIVDLPGMSLPVRQLKSSNGGCHSSGALLSHRLLEAAGTLATACWGANASSSELSCTGLPIQSCFPNKDQSVRCQIPSETSKRNETQSIARLSLGFLRLGLLAVIGLECGATDGQDHGAHGQKT